MENNITPSDGSGEEIKQTIEMSVSLRKEGSEANISSSSGILRSARALRKAYVYELRDNYIEEFKEIPSTFEMNKFKEAAQKLYPKEGDYIVRDGVAMYLGIG